MSTETTSSTDREITSLLQGLDTRSDTVGRQAWRHYQTLSHGRLDVTIWKCVVSDRNLACAVLIGLETLSDGEVCSHGNCMFCPAVVRLCPIVDRGVYAGDSRAQLIWSRLVTRPGWKLWQRHISLITSYTISLTQTHSSCLPFQCNRVGELFAKPSWSV